jgi:hypothetical protein
LNDGSLLRATTVTCDPVPVLGSIVTAWRGEFSTPTPAPLICLIGDACTIIRDDGKAIRVTVTGFHGGYAVTFQSDGDFQ